MQEQRHCKCHLLQTACLALLCRHCWGLAPLCSTCNRPALIKQGGSPEVLLSSSKHKTHMLATVQLPCLHDGGSTQSPCERQQCRSNISNQIKIPRLNDEVVAFRSAPEMNKYVLCCYGSKRGHAITWRPATAPVTANLCFPEFTLEAASCSGQQVIPALSCLALHVPCIACFHPTHWLVEEAYNVCHLGLSLSAAPALDSDGAACMVS